MNYHRIAAWIALLALFTLALPPAFARAGGEGLDSLADKKEFRAARASSADPNHRDHDFVRMAPGKSITLADVKGAGQLVHFWFASSPSSSYCLRALVLRMTWDDAARPAVECPLGDFFVQGGGRYTLFSSEPVATGAFHALNCYWPMPFTKHAVVTLTNEGPQRIKALYYQIDYQLEDQAPDPKDCRYFHVQYRTYFPAPVGAEFTLLETTGCGHYVGYSITTLANSNGWQGEENDRFYIDEVTRPTFEGIGGAGAIGGAGYFGGAGGIGHAFATPDFGVPLFMGTRRGATTVCYRWRIRDPVPFKTSLKVTREIGSRGPDNDRKQLPNHYTIVAYYYLDRPADETQPIPPYSRRVPGMISVK